MSPDEPLGGTYDFANTDQGDSGDDQQVADGQKPDPIREELDSIRRQQEDFQLRVLSMMGQLNRGNTPVQAGQEPKKMDVDMWKLGQTVPEVMPSLIEGHVGPMLETRMEQMKKDLISVLDKRDIGAKLSASLGQHYADDIANRDSEIIKATPEARSLIEPLLDPSVRGTAQADQLAYLLAASLNPKAVAKREVARERSQADARRAAQDRAGALGGSGGRGNFQAKEPEVDEDLAAKLGIKLDDAARARIKGYMKTERLSGISSLMGMGIGGEEQ